VNEADSGTYRELVEWIRHAVAEILSVGSSEVDPDRPLTELGLGSRDAVGLVGELETHLGRTIEPTVVFETPTVALLAARLLDDGPVSTVRPVVTARAQPDEPVAVVGIGCRLPGDVVGPESFWELLLAGTDAIGDLPDGRWDRMTPPGPGSAAVAAGTPRHGGFLTDVAAFDAEHFGISPHEAVLMDPQQRILLEVTWEALQHGGIDPDSLRGSATGVFIGMCGNEYARLTTADLVDVEAYTSTGAGLSIAANRLSYLFDLRGPSVTLDTACSSSLVAVHQAMASIRAGEIDAAIVGGVNLLLSPVVTVSFDRAGALAADGRCKPFSDDADGMRRRGAQAARSRPARR
jgi:phthiocerol/phenolphthiocerol synthesis type-I polyketide synthase D